MRKKILHIWMHKIGNVIVYERELRLKNVGLYEKAMTSIIESNNKVSLNDVIFDKPVLHFVCGGTTVEGG